MKALVLALTFSAAIACAVPADAQGRGGGRGGGGGGAARSAPASRPAAAPSRPSSGGAGGFNLNKDVAAGAKRPNPPSRPPTASVPNRPAGSGNGNTMNRPGGNNNVGSGNTVNRPGGNNKVGNGSGNTINRGGNTVNNVNVNRPAMVTRAGYYNGRPIVVNPIYRGPAWGWNNGVSWGPAPGYWGGGFWGSLAISATSAAVSAAVYGSIVSNNQTYTSYQVQPSSPGSTLLQNYHLTQAQCAPPDLVVIYGPSNSLICAQPNDLVGPGYYDLDTSQLTIISRS